MDAGLGWHFTTVQRHEQDQALGRDLVPFASSGMRSSARFFRQMWRTQPFLTNHNGLTRRSGGKIIRTGFDWFQIRVFAGGLGLTRAGHVPFTSVGKTLAAFKKAVR
ncbi:MAG: hypothetical protein AAB879_00490 [Patescibacteria group bacterium]